MYNILLIDDEPVIVNSLYHLFSQMEEPVLQVWKAYSARDGISVLEGNRIDILITDVRMPGMTGLELCSLIRVRWPKCKVIFLSGYSDYEYLQTAIREEAFDYLLKPINDKTLQETINSVIVRIEQEMIAENIVKRAEDQLHKAKELLIKDFFGELLQGSHSNMEWIEKQIHSLQIPLRSDQNLLFMIARIDRWTAENLMKEKFLAQYAIGTIVEENLSQMCTVFSYPDSRYMTWILQVDESKQQGTITSLPQLHWYVIEMLENIQHSIRQSVNLPCSFIVSKPEVEWSNVHEAFSVMCQLFQKGIGLDEEIILVDNEDEIAAHYEQPSLQPKEIKRRVQQLAHALEVGETALFRDYLNQFLCNVQKSAFLDYSLQLEIFFHLSAMFLSHMNARKLTPQLDHKTILEGLSNIDKHSDWFAIGQYFNELADLLFTYGEGERKEQKKEIVDKVDAMIVKSLKENVTLLQLAKYVHLSPYYLSRLYHAEKGLSISERMKQLKVARAKELLLIDGLKIQDAAIELGFENIPYFTKFFKKNTGLTPQEYKQGYGGQ